MGLVLLSRIRIRGEGRDLRGQADPNIEHEKLDSTTEKNARKNFPIGAAPVRKRSELPENPLPDGRGSDETCHSHSRSLKGSPDGPLLEPYSLTALLSPGHVLGEMVRVLRSDSHYRQYCWAQMLTGISNLMTVSIVVTIITRDLVPGDARGFWISMVLLDALPKLVMLGSLSRWGRVFDRLGVLSMRELNLLCWASSIFFGFCGDLATLPGSQSGPALFLLGITFFALRGIAAGLGQGGGAVAWYIGHLHFAKPEDAEVYMGIHVSLTGLRGLVAPLAGMWLWQWIGWPVWVIALTCSLASFRMYSTMAREEQRLTGQGTDGTGAGVQ